MAGGHGVAHGPVKYGRWYGYGIAFITLEALFSLAITAYAIYMALTGHGGIAAH